MQEPNYEKLLQQAESCRAGQPLVKDLANALTCALVIKASTETANRILMTILTEGKRMLTLVRHRKRNKLYQVVGEAEGQVSKGSAALERPDAPNAKPMRMVQDGTMITVYQDDTGKLWWRFPDEFADGRFEYMTTVSSNWRKAGQPDPYGNRYDCERRMLIGGDLTDDQVANLVYLEPTLVNLTIAKDRIRWLSRRLMQELMEKRDGR
jgi:hypothetical protein